MRFYDEIKSRVDGFSLFVRRTNRSRTVFAAAIMGSVGLLVSCTAGDDTIESGSEVNVKTGDVIVNNNASDFEGRITLFAPTGTRTGTRAIENSARTLSMPEQQPSIPDDALELSDDLYKDYNSNHYSEYFDNGRLKSSFTNKVIKKGNTFSTYSGLGGTWYVCGTLDLTNSYFIDGGSCEIYIMEGGTLKYPTSMSLQMKVYNYGMIEFTGETLNIDGSNACLMTSGNLKIAHLIANGNLYVGGDLTCTDMTSNSNGVIAVMGNATFSGDKLKYDDVNQNFKDKDFEGYVKLSGADMYVDKKLSSGYFEMNSGASLTAGCASSFDGFYIDNSSSYDVLGYFSANKTMLNSGTLNVSNNAYLDFGDLILTSNDGNCTINVDDAEDGSAGTVYAKAKNITTNSLDRPNTITGTSDGYTMYMNYTDVTYSGTTYNFASGAEGKFTFNSQVSMISVENLKGEMEISGLLVDGDFPVIDNKTCAGTSSAPESKPEKGLVIDEVAQVNPDHTHDYSSTCVQINGNYSYLSWHIRGGKSTQQEGCLEVIDHTDRTAPKLVSYMQTADKNMEYNHCIVDGDKLYAVGNSNVVGGMLASISLTDGIFTPSTVGSNMDLLSYLPLSKGIYNSCDGNCIIKNGSDFLVTSSSGFQTLDASTLETKAFEEQVGSGKHIYSEGENMVTLNLGGRGTTSADAIIKVWKATDHTFKTPIREFKVGEITPINGKNVIKIDGNNVHVCLGQNGFVTYTLDGQFVGSFIRDTQSAVNGMDCDENYIYLAYGSDGLVVLKKTPVNGKYEEATKYPMTPAGKSANYVRAVSDGYIYVAYGKNGLRIYQLIEK